MERSEEILDFWFGEIQPDGSVLPEKKTLWFKKQQSTDDTIRNNFEPDLKRILNGELSAWQEKPRSLLAGILIMDQFTRNMYREKPESFSGDAEAQRWSLLCLEKGFDKELPAVQRMFLYMPLEHSEDLTLQDKSVDCFTRLKQEAPEGVASMIASFHTYAEQHREIIRRFGRFSHRNKILGRTNTDEETEFLTQPGSSF